MEVPNVHDESLHDTDDRAGELARAVEALVFATDEPVAAEQIAAVFAEITREARPSSEQIQQTVDRLNARYEQQGGALRIQAWAGGFRMSTTGEVAPYLKAFFRHDRQRRLTRSLMETLAILAYKQPATKPEIDYVRGVDSDYALRRLLDIGLIEEVVEKGAALDRGLALAERVGKQSPPAVTACKGLIQQARSGHIAGAYTTERDAFVGLFDTVDQKEGVNAFLEKRQPQWING